MKSVQEKKMMVKNMNDFSIIFSIILFCMLIWMSCISSKLNEFYLEYKVENKEIIYQTRERLMTSEVRIDRFAERASYKGGTFAEMSDIQKLENELDELRLKFEEKINKKMDEKQ
jgi:hypothetical protein